MKMATQKKINESDGNGGDFDGEEAAVINVTFSNFVADVVEASRKHLVIIYFWAPWCGTCKQLGPLLEKLVLRYDGGVKLAKINIDSDPQIAQQMGVQSIPTVFAFLRGQPVDGFVGIIAETQLKPWMDRLVKAANAEFDTNKDSDLVSALKQAKAFLDAGVFVKARSIYNDVLDLAPEDVEARAGLIKCTLGEGKLDEVRELFNQIPESLAEQKEFEALRAEFDLLEQAQNSTGNPEDIKARLQENENDHQTRFDLAMAHYAAGNRSAAVDALIDIVRRDRKWNEEAARKQLVKFFEVFGPMDELTISTRKRLSSILFS